MKDTRELSVLYLQLSCKSEITEKKKSNRKKIKPEVPSQVGIQIQTPDSLKSLVLETALGVFKECYLLLIECWVLDALR